MSNPKLPGGMPSFPSMGVSRLGESLSPQSLPPAPETPPVDPAKVAAMTDPASAPPAMPSEAVAASTDVRTTLLLDDDFFEAMTLADRIAALTEGEVRTASSEQKAAAILEDEQPSLAVLSTSAEGDAALNLARKCRLAGVPFVLVGGPGAATTAFPDVPVFEREAKNATIYKAISVVMP